MAFDETQPGTGPEEVTLTQPGGPVNLTALGCDCDPDDDRIIAQRYRLLGQIGRGGLAAVYRALDQRTGDTVALKLLRVGAGEDAEQARALFEREFHTLRQLAHPSIIEVHDYGLGTDGRPHYTMELLSGQDLRELAPLPWREVCELLLPVASSLAVLHSRRLLHRDVSARNVRRTTDGRAKLLDFGAMGVMGEAQRTMGTPPYLAPEALHGQPLDGRTDLYAFGALMYLMLTGRHAYPARSLTDLRDRWRSRVRSPRQRNPEVPTSVSELVMALLSLDPSARPSTAGEVMARLGGIAELPLEEDPAVHRAYLTTPKLVARDAALIRVRKLLVRTRRGRGGSLHIEAASGLGRSRLLDACMLEGKLAGVITARVGAGEQSGEDFAAALSLAKQVSASFPTPPRTPELAPDGHPRARSELQAALRAWFLGASDRHALALLVDDFHGIDEASAALLATLADDAGRARLALIVTAQAGATHSAALAWDVLSRRSSAIALEPLTPARSEALLLSIFGDVPHVRHLAARLHAVAEGNPRTLIELAEQLVDAGTVSYDAGNWVLPGSLEDITHERAVEWARAQIGALSTGARTLAEALALAPDLGFDHAECAVLADVDGESLFAAIDELERARIITTQGGLQRLAHDGCRGVLQADPAKLRRRHLLLARVLERRGSRSRAAVHRAAAGELDAAVELLVGVAEAASSDPTADPDASLALRTSQAYGDMLAAAVDAARSDRERLLLRLLVVELGVHAEPALLMQHLPPLLERLARDCGLADYAPVGSEECWHQVRDVARARNDATAPEERTLTPEQALPLLTRVCMAAAQTGLRWFDCRVLDMLPSLEPLVHLSPTVWVTTQSIAAYRAVVAGRYEECRDLYEDVLERLAQPDRAGLDPAAHTRAVLGARAGLALVIATWPSQAALTHAAHLEQSPYGAVLSCHVRALYHLCRGDADSAEHWQRKAELMEIQGAPRELSGRRQVHPQLVCAAYADDLLGIKQLLGSVAELAQRWPAWKAIECFTRASYDHMRGDPEAALRNYDAALELAQPGRHLTWPIVAERRLWLLVELGRFEQVIEEGQQVLEICARERLATWMVKPIAIARAQLGQHALAATLADEEVQRWEALEATGLHLGRAYETRARVAMLAGDSRAFEKYAALTALHLLAGDHPRLRAKYERLLEDARGLGMTPDGEPLDAAADDEYAGVRRMLQRCDGAQQRASAALELLERSAGVRSGALFGVGPHGLQLLASDCDAPEAMAAFVDAYLSAEIEVSTTLTQPEDADVFVAASDRYHPVLLRTEVDDEELIVALAMLARGDDRGCEHAPELLETLAKSILEAGDVVAVRSAG